MENIIECKNLTHYYGNRLIYKDLNFTVPRGKIVGLLGRNGTGKTTTINILSGYLKPASGECKIFGENIQTMAPVSRQNIGLLIEGHVQYQFMTIKQIEKFYSQFYPKWQRDAFYGLMDKLQVANKQPISKMSCGQRSQVALGLILAQNPKLLVLDDFSLGLDPGYRRLFVDYLRDYASAEDKTVFLTSHIIQDMERLVDDCIIMDYGRVLLQRPITELLNGLNRYTFTTENSLLPEKTEEFINPSKTKEGVEVYSFLPPQEMISKLGSLAFSVTDICHHKLNLEDAFIGLTGKY